MSLRPFFFVFCFFGWVLLSFCSFSGSSFVSLSASALLCMTTLLRAAFPALWIRLIAATAFFFFFSFSTELLTELFQNLCVCPCFVSRPYCTVHGLLHRCIYIYIYMPFFHLLLVFPATTACGNGACTLVAWYARHSRKRCPYATAAF